MPRYFFHMSGLADYTDEWGTELPNDQDAWRTALAATGETLRDMQSIGEDTAELEVRVTSHTGRQVAIVHLSGTRHGVKPQQG